jgi:hypothetical protein
MLGNRRTGGVQPGEAPREFDQPIALVRATTRPRMSYWTLDIGPISISRTHPPTVVPLPACGQAPSGSDSVAWSYDRTGLARTWWLSPESGVVMHG